MANNSYNNFPVFGKSLQLEPMYSDAVSALRKMVTVIVDHIEIIEQELEHLVVKDVTMNSTYVDSPGPCASLPVVDLFSAPTNPQETTVQLNMRPILASDNTLDISYDATCDVIDAKLGNVAPDWAAYVIGGYYGNTQTKSLPASPTYTTLDSSFKNGSETFFGMLVIPAALNCFDFDGPFGTISTKGPGSFVIMFSMDIRVSNANPSTTFEMTFFMNEYNTVTMVNTVLPYTIVQVLVQNNVLNNITATTFLVNAPSDVCQYTLLMSPSIATDVILVNYRSQLRNISIIPT